MSYKEQLFERLNNAGVVGSDVFGSVTELKYTPDMEQLNCLPDETVKNLLLTDFDSKDSIEEIVSKWAKKGLLKFDPYTVQDRSNYPSLALKYNRYLHLFRNHYFQVSYTEKGIGEYATGSIRADSILDDVREAWDVFDLDSNSSDLYQALMYMNAIAAAHGIDSFDNLLLSKPEVVDDFMKRTMLSWRLCSDYTMTYNKLKQYITAETRSMDLEHKYKDIYRVPASNTSDYCRIRVHDIEGVLRASIELIVNGMPVIYTLNLPGILNDNIIRDFNETEMEDYNDVWNYFKQSRTFIESQIVFLLNYFGYTINYTVCYPNIPKSKRDNVTTLRALNRPHMVTLNNLSSVVEDSCY